MTKEANPSRSSSKLTKLERSPDPGDAGETQKVGKKRPIEIGGRKGPDPTRYGDWEHKGRCIDF